MLKENPKIINSNTHITIVHILMIAMFKTPIVV